MSDSERKTFLEMRELEEQAKRLASSFLNANTSPGVREQVRPSFDKTAKRISEGRTLSFGPESTSDTDRREQWRRKNGRGAEGASVQGPVSTPQDVLRTTGKLDLGAHGALESADVIVSRFPKGRSNQKQR